jgi:hypothetical protein
MTFASGPQSAQRPDYDSLPLHSKSGKRSCWGIWDKSGVPDHLGGKPTIHFQLVPSLSSGLTLGSTEQFNRGGKTSSCS